MRDIFIIRYAVPAPLLFEALDIAAAFSFYHHAMPLFAITIIIIACFHTPPMW